MGFFSSITKPFKKAWNAVENVVSNTWDAVVDTTKDVVDLAAPFVGAGSQLAGGVMSSNANSASNAANLALAREQFEWQKAYAQNRLQWQVEDAKKAGLHPMVAAGLSPTSFSPVSANVSPIDYDWVGQAGQSLSYAAAKAKTNRQQEAAFNFQMQLGQEQLNGVRLDNELKMMNILSEVSRLTQTGPAAPTANSTTPLNEPDDPFVKHVPDEVTRSDPSNPSSTAGTHPLWTHARSGNFIVPVLSDKLADAITENKEKHLGAEGSYAHSAWRGEIKPPMSALTKHEQYLMKTGDYTLNYYPLLGWRVEPKVTAKNFRKFLHGGFRSGPSVSGKIVR